MTGSDLTRNMQWRIAAHPQRWLGLMLLPLHGATAWGFQPAWSYPFLLVHFGLFLMWQPLWRGERTIAAPRAGLLILSVLALLLVSGWWLITLWLAVLLGVIGGTMPGVGARRQRLVYLLAALYLLSMLLMWAVPNLLFKRQELPTVAFLVRYGLLPLPVLIMFIRVEAQRPGLAYAVDFFYSVMLFLLVVVLVLGSFAVMTLTQEAYPLALAKTLVAMAAALLLASWLWNPLGGFAGLGHLLSRYVLSVGLPFERWLQEIAVLAEREADPAAFLRNAMTGIAELPWVAGGEWRTREDHGSFGERARHSVEFSFHSFTLVLHTRWRLSPALALHVKLLTQLLGYFFEAKLREQALKQNAYTQAIYETGARLTHDVKNLLQSLKTLCAAAESSDAGQADALQALMKRQLPQVAQRLQGTLEKLQAPASGTEGESAAAGPWWHSLCQRHAGSRIDFHGGPDDPAQRVPAELFDSVADNLLQNALEKRKLQRELRIGVEFSGAVGGVLTVCDDGVPVEAGTAARLGSAPVRSESGLGIGLYQAARQARQRGYRLELTENRPGRVCFALRRDGG